MSKSQKSEEVLDCIQALKKMREGTTCAVKGPLLDQAIILLQELEDRRRGGLVQRVDRIESCLEGVLNSLPTGFREDTTTMKLKSLQLCPHCGVDAVWMRIGFDGRWCYSCGKKVGEIR